jgi:hypothetical protein
MWKIVEENDRVTTIGDFVPTGPDRELDDTFRPREPHRLSDAKDLQEFQGIGLCRHEKRTGSHSEE